MHSPCKSVYEGKWGGDRLQLNKKSRRIIKKAIRFPSDKRVFVIIVKLHLQECYSAF